MRYLVAVIILLLSNLLPYVQANQPKKTSQLQVATLDWTVAETLQAMGISPIAVGDIPSYQVWVQQPVLSNSIDLGLRLQPNLEQISQLPIDLFINTSMYAGVTATLSRYAEVKSVDFYHNASYHNGSTWQQVLMATKQIANWVGAPEKGKQLIAQVEQNLQAMRPHFAAFKDRPFAIVQFSDTRHLRIYANNSLFAEVLTQLGLTNVWDRTGNIWGTENIDISQLAQLPANTRLIIVKPYPVNVSNSLKNNTLWQALPLAQDPIILPAIWTFGGLPSAQRFAEALLDFLQHNRSELW